MKSIALAIYLLIGLLFAHYHIKKANDKITTQIESGEVDKKTEEIINQSDRLSSMVGQRNFLALIYIVFSVAWLPALIYAKLIKKGKSDE